MLGHAPTVVETYAATQVSRVAGRAEGYRIDQFSPEERYG